MSDEAAPLRELSAQERDIAQAREDLDHILALQKSPAFNHYFRRRLNEMSAPLERALLRDKLSFEDYREKQAALAVLTEIRDLLTNDEIGNRSITGR